MLITLVVFAVVSGAAAISADDYVPAERKQEVEVAPGRFVNLRRWDWTVDDPANTSKRERTLLRIPQGDRDLVWEGVAIPIVLREEGGRLYLVGYDRETTREAYEKARDSRVWVKRNRYYRQDRDRFEEIKPVDFPKHLATQNMWLTSPAAVRAAVALDPSDPDFRSLAIAQVWRELLTGEPPSDDVRVEKHVLDEFVRRFKPSKLTEIERTKPAAPKQ